MRVPTVAFAFMSPEAVRIFLAVTGYHVSVFTGEEKLIFRGPPEKNIVLLPNFTKRHALAPYADQIGRLVILANGRYEELAEHDIPILDAVIKDGDIEIIPSKTPNYYLKRINSAAKPLELADKAITARPKKKEKITAETASTLDQWLDVIDEFNAVQDFNTEVNIPVCSYLIGDLSKDDLQGAFKAVVKNADTAEIKPAIKSFYRWITHKDQKRLVTAVKHYLKSDQPSSVVAKEFKVSPVDLEVVESVFYASQNKD